MISQPAGRRLGIERLVYSPFSLHIFYSFFLSFFKSQRLFYLYFDISLLRIRRLLFACPRVAFQI